MLVVNFIGGPCAGKTTNAMGLAYHLKRDYVSCTLSLEYIGGLIHSAREEVLKDQAYIFGNQNHNLEILKNKGYDIVITDASLLNSIIYAPDHYPKSFRQFVFDMYRGYENFNVFLFRNHPYSNLNRIHTEDQAEAASSDLYDLMRVNEIPMLEMQAGDNVPELVKSEIRKLRPDIWTKAELSKKRSTQPKSAL